MKIGNSVVLRGTIKGVTYGEYGFPYYLVTLPNGCETEFPKLYIENLQQLDEPQPVKVPQCVADVIEGAREQSPELEDALHYACSNGSQEFTEWYQKKSNRDLFARAWLDGYEVEEEKRYLVKMKGMSEENTYLTFRFGHTWMLSNFEECEEFRLHHTRKQLEEAGFGWVFNCEGIEIEEVE
ncbi:DUF1642 domain-containing protein [Streptococcus sp. 116-D4]|uniref:DUF1642 domain-containing protein n=1 Tax=Streptococcus sp. 116-D4 TaxID=2598453 RepID=UPI0012B4D996|nr:DUF1642 domain-containing protein [Streptococcus sp. 116-D4]BBP09852.1 hypothetical protein UKS_10540 [Streptococcus sp. 116-D4]